MNKYIANSSSFKCVENCTSPNMYISNGTCVSSCNRYNNITLQCSNTCNYVVNETGFKICSTCSDYMINHSVDSTPDTECVDVCEEYQFINGDYCAITCPTGFY